MGLKATIDEGHCVIIDGDKVIQRFFLSAWKEHMKDALHGGDYVEIVAQRRLPLCNCHEITDFDDVENSKSRDPPEEGPPCGASGFSLHFSVCFHGHWNKTLEELDEEFRSVEKEWKESKECKALIAQLKHLKLVATRPVTNVVAFGIGSLHDSHHEGMRRTAAKQLATILMIRDYFGGTGEPLHCVIQDPVFSKREKQYFHSLGLEVLDDPDAFSRIDASSLVFHAGTYLDLAWWISKGIWPTAMVCNDWGNPGPDLSRHYPLYCAPDVRVMFEEYDHVPFIPDRDGRDWEDINLYWRT